jgi:hypothetical protein
LPSWSRSRTEDGLVGEEFPLSLCKGQLSTFDARGLSLDLGLALHCLI